MNDEQLRSELERRAGSAPTQPDWAKRVLLPAVRHEIDARPQPVVTSRLPSLARVAALVAALVGLVIAVPRVAPQPPGPSHSQSPLPTPTTPLSASGPTYACTGPDWDGRSIELTDHVGVVESCVATRVDGPEERAVVSEISRGLVGVTWEDCAGDGATLEFWPREDAPERPRYILTIEKSSPRFPQASCRGVIPGVTVEITFMNAELAPENLATDIEAHLMRGGRASDGIETSAGQFYLTVSAGTAQYSIDDPIDIQAQLLYEGDQPAIDLSGVFSLVNGFGIEQLDGNLEMGPGWEEPCVPHQLQAGEPLTVPFKKSAAWSPDDPNADFYRGWSAEPLLHLPAGTWLVTAYSDFMLGSGCSGERLQMQASIIITVVDVPDAEPNPTSAAGATFDCPPTYNRSGVSGAHATVVDQTGLVTECTAPAESLVDWSEDHPMQIGNPEGDTTALQIVWGGTPCDAAREYVLRREGDSYVLRGRSLASGPCILPLVIHTIQLTLSAPIDVSMVALRWNDSPPPTPTPSPMEPGTQTYNCGSDADGSEIAFIDHSGLIAACTTRTSDQPAGSPIAANSGDLEHMIVTWPIKPGACAMGRAELEFWGPRKPSGDYLDDVVRDFVLRVARHSPTSCDGSARAQSVELLLNAPVSADDVEAFVSDLGGGGGNFTTVRAETGSGSFELSLGGGNWDWAAGEPIAITAGLLFEGAQESVTLSGMFKPRFGFEQLDGDLEVPPFPIILLCPPTDHTLRSGVDDFTDFRVSQGAGNEQYGEYFNEFGYDDRFRLPSGTYRLYASVFFNVGSDCHGESSVQLQTSVVIRVR